MSYLTFLDRLEYNVAQSRSEEAWWKLVCQDKYRVRCDGGLTVL